MRGSRGGMGHGVRTPLRSQPCRVLNNTVLDLLKIKKLASQYSMLGHHRHDSETPLNGVSLAAVDGPAYNGTGIWTLPPLINLNSHKITGRQSKAHGSLSSSPR